MQMTTEAGYVIDTTDVVRAIGDMDERDLALVLIAYKRRVSALRETEAIVNKSVLTPGTRVVTKGLRPKYLNGLHGVVTPTSEVNRRTRQFIPVLLDEADRLRAGRYATSRTLRVPANCLETA